MAGRGRAAGPGEPLGGEAQGLRTLLEVARSPTFDDAAVSLGVTPSAVSQRIKALEQRTGRVLVHRTKPVTLTRAGEVLVRLAGQVELLEREAAAELVATEGAGGGAGEGPAAHVPLVLNADTLTAWILPALVRVQERRRVAFEIVREDEAHTLELLRRGDAMAAVTSQSRAVSGCRVVALGVMRYHPLATPGFVQSWFAEGVTAATLGRAPVLNFDRRDTMQDGFMRTLLGHPLDPPSHYVPSAHDFDQAVRLGLGWGMLPEVLARDEIASGRLVEIVEGGHRDLTLYWQHWSLESPLIDDLTEAVVEAARSVLRPVR